MTEQLTPEDWFKRARAAFNVDKPDQFNDYHCDECIEVDSYLKSLNVDSADLQALDGSMGNPFNLCSVEGIQYFLPAMIRVTLETMRSDFYLEVFLWHLESDGPDNHLVTACSAKQRALIVEFLTMLLENYTNEIQFHRATDPLLKSHAIWSKDLPIQN